MEIANLKEHAEFIPTLAAWHYEQWSYLHADDSVDKRIAALKNEFESDGIPETFVAFSGNTPLGSASLIPHDMDTRMELSPWLASVFVAPEFRDRRIGSALVRHVIKEAGRLGYRTIYLFTTDDRLAFYSRLGWSLLEKTEYHGQNVHIMSINIKG